MNTEFLNVYFEFLVRFLSLLLNRYDNCNKTNVFNKSLREVKDYEIKLQAFNMRVITAEDEFNEFFMLSNKVVMCMSLQHL